MSIYSQLLIPIVKQYIQHNKIKLENPSILNDRWKEQGQKYLEKVLEVAKSDMEAAGFGLPTKNPTSLQKQAFNISLTHGLTKLAEYLVTGRQTLEEIK